MQHELNPSLPYRGSDFVCLSFLCVDVRSKSKIKKVIHKFNEKQGKYNDDLKYLFIQSERSFMFVLKRPLNKGTKESKIKKLPPPNPPPKKKQDIN